jgi:hypothetical protein
MSRLGKDWTGMIERIKRCGAGTYGTPFFMARKDEHWKFLWAAERIAELEAENAKLLDENVGLLAACDSLTMDNDALREVGDE